MNGNSSFWYIYGLSNKGSSESEEEEKEPKSEFLKMSLDFIAGCLGGCAGVVVGHPLDTVKVHLQTQDIAKPKYRGTWHCFSSILREEKVRGLYRGMASPMAGVAFVNAIVFGVYGSVQRNTSDPSSLLSHFYAGSTAGLVQSFVCSPIELAKTRMQLQTDGHTGIKHKGSFDCLRHVIRNEGVKGTFHGLGITILRDIPAFAAYFVSYEYMMRLPSAPNSMHAFIAGGFAGMFSWWVCYPQDVIKSCLQSESPGAHAKYQGIVDCINKGYRSDGLRFFFRGFTPTMIRSFPSNAACFFVVSVFMRLTQSSKIDLVVHTGDPLNVASLTAQHVSHFHNQRQEEALRDKRRLRLMTTSMKASNGFHEAVCHREVEELANELYTHRKEESDSKYFVFEDNRLTWQTNVTMPSE